MTQWNQDSGEYWMNEPDNPDPNSPAALQLHFIEFKVLRPIIDTIGIEGNVTVTVLGSSPLDGDADHDLAMGVKLVAFVRKTSLAWREGGTKSVLYFMGEPTESYYVQGNDSLFYPKREASPLSLEQILELVKAQRGD